MLISAYNILIAAYLLTGMLVIAGFLKKLRSDSLIIKLIPFCIIIAFMGLLIRSEKTDLPNGNAADFFFGPLIYILTYGFLRFIYKKKFKVEPTYNRSSLFDYEEGRKQNWLDIIVFIFPLILSFFLPFIFDI